MPPVKVSIGEVKFNSINAITQKVIRFFPLHLKNEKIRKGFEILWIPKSLEIMSISFHLYNLFKYFLEIYQGNDLLLWVMEGVAMAILKELLELRDGGKYLLNHQQIIMFVVSKNLSSEKLVKDDT